MNAATTRRARALLAGTAVAGAVLLTGCQVISPRQTEEMYDAGDGVSLDLGDLELRNLVVISEAAAGPGVVSGTVGNPTGLPIRVSFATAEGASAEAEVPAHSTLNVSVDDEPVVLAGVAEAPGAMTTLTVTTAEAGSAPVEVPVLPPVGYYEALAPS